MNKWIVCLLFIALAFQTKAQQYFTSFKDEKNPKGVIYKGILNKGILQNETAFDWFVGNKEKFNPSPNLYLLSSISCAFEYSTTKTSKILKVSILFRFFIFVSNFIKLISKIPRTIYSQSINNNIWRIDIVLSKNYSSWKNID